MSESFELDQPNLFTAGAVGQPGKRTFFLQAAEPGQVVSVKCEKEQVGVLAEYLGQVLEDLPAVTEPVSGELDLVEPAVPEWVAGTMGVAYDESSDRVVLLIEELHDDDDNKEDDPLSSPASLRLTLTRAQVEAFIARARRLVEAGRPPCPLCGRPLDPEGHMCPRTNGHRTRH